MLVSGNLGNNANSAELTFEVLGTLLKLRGKPLVDNCAVCCLVAAVA